MTTQTQERVPRWACAHREAAALPHPRQTPESWVPHKGLFELQASAAWESFAAAVLEHQPKARARPPIRQPVRAQKTVTRVLGREVGAAPGPSDDDSWAQRMCMSPLRTGVLVPPHTHPTDNVGPGLGHVLSLRVTPGVCACEESDQGRRRQEEERRVTGWFSNKANP